MISSSTVNLDSLLAERDIYRKLVGFARAMDNRDWAAIHEITTDDIVADMGMGEIEGRAAVIDFIRSFLRKCGTTQHILGNVLITIDGDTAKSSAYVSDMHLGKGTKDELTFRTLGDYHDEWIRVDGVWLMCRRVKDNRAIVGSFEVFGMEPNQGNKIN